MASTLMALSRRTGGVRWTADLPGKLWAGPVLGGGRLLAVSSEGQLASVSAQTGEILNTTDVGDKLLYRAGHRQWHGLPSPDVPSDRSADADHASAFRFRSWHEST